jgi:amphi-Trp domain-containing protein
LWALERFALGGTAAIAAWLLTQKYLRGSDIMKEERDIEKSYTKKDFVAKLRRLADSIENGSKFKIQIAGERIYVPVKAEFNIEHEREGTEEEIEFQIKWKNK